MAAERGQSGAQTFDAGRFGRWLRMLMVSFYTDEEAALADVLYRKQAMMKDNALAKLLQLPERQVRQLLERRLVPDCIVDRCAEGTGERVHTFYRISPVAAAVAAKRFQQLETSLSATVEEQYICSKCNRLYDTLKAMSLSFKCECGEALVSTAETSAARRDRLRRFHVQCKDLLQLTQELQNQPGPDFGHPPKVRKPRGAAKQAAQAKGSAPKSLPSQPPSVTDADWTLQDESATASQVKEDSEAQCPEPAPDRATASASGAKKEISKTLEEEVTSAQSGRARTSLEDRLLGARMSQPRPVEEDPAVLVRGVPHPLSHVLADDLLQEQMTDEEYQSFYDVDRALHHRKLQSLLS